MNWSNGQVGWTVCTSSQDLSPKFRPVEFALESGNTSLPDSSLRTSHRYLGLLCPNSVLSQGVKGWGVTDSGLTLQTSWLTGLQPEEPQASAGPLGSCRRTRAVPYNLGCSGQT